MRPPVYFVGRAATTPRIVAILAGYACVRLALDVCKLILKVIGE